MKNFLTSKIPGWAIGGMVFIILNLISYALMFGCTFYIQGEGAIGCSLTIIPTILTMLILGSFGIHSNGIFVVVISFVLMFIVGSLFGALISKIWGRRKEN